VRSPTVTLPGRLAVSRRDVHGVADHRVLAAHRAREHLARVHAHAEGERHAVGVTQPLVDLGHRVLHAERGANRTLRVVLVRDGRTEDRHHVVADVLVHAAAVALHLFTEAAQAALNEAFHGLGIHRLRHRRVTGQVSEHDGDLTALLGEREHAGLDHRRTRRGRLLHRGAAVHAEAGLGGELGAADGAATLQRAAARHAEARALRVLVRTARTDLARHGSRTISRHAGGVCDVCCVFRARELTGTPLKSGRSCRSHEARAVLNHLEEA
jgi:hypothetical protein